MWTLIDLLPSLIFLSSVLLALIFGIVIINTKDKLKRNGRILKEFEHNRIILEYNLNKAYDLIHKDEILIYSLEATKLPDEDFNRVTKEFVKLVIKIMGPRLLSHFIFMYGDYDTFLFNLVEFFNSKYEEDEIRDAAQQDLMESEVETGDIP